MAAVALCGLCMEEGSPPLYTCRQKVGSSPQSTIYMTVEQASMLGVGSNRIHNHTGGKNKHKLWA